MSQHYLINTNPKYFNKLLTWKNIKYSLVGNIADIEGFPEYSNLLKINSIFSTCPRGNPVDRTNTVSSPLKFKVLREYNNIKTEVSLDDFFSSRVNEFLKTQERINLMWSGGTDSTAFVTAFLSIAGDTKQINQLRLIYTPYSLYENLDFFQFIQNKFPELETLDISGDVYLNFNFDGLLITGHGGDEHTSSLDESFYESTGFDVVNSNWQDYFYTQSGNLNFVNWCDTFFKLSGRPINSLLEARWWFYTISKSQVYGPNDVVITSKNNLVDVGKVVSFYDCDNFENYMYFNTDKILPSGDYSSYKKFLREYTHKLYKNSNYLDHTRKTNSTQFGKYRDKKLELLDQQWIFMLDNGQLIRTKNLPFFSKAEFDAEHGTTYDYLFTQHD